MRGLTISERLTRYPHFILEFGIVHEFSEALDFLWGGISTKLHGTLRDEVSG